MVWKPATERVPVYLLADGTPATEQRHDIIISVAKYPNPRGIGIPIDVEKLVSSIHISPTSGDWFLELVQSVSTKLGYSFAIHKSELATPPPFAKLRPTNYA